MSEYIYHITTDAKWRDAEDSGEYLPMELMADGFIHASYYNQLKQVLDFLFTSYDSVLVLEIDPLYLHCEVKVENTTGGKELFPHIYGTLPSTAVIRTFHLKQDSRGFVIPKLESTL